MCILLNHLNGSSFNLDFVSSNGVEEIGGSVRKPSSHTLSKSTVIYLTYATHGEDPDPNLDGDVLMMQLEAHSVYVHAYPSSNPTFNFSASNNMNSHSTSKSQMKRASTSNRSMRSPTHSLVLMELSQGDTLPIDRN